MSRMEFEDIAKDTISPSNSSSSPKEERVKWTSDQDATLTTLAVAYNGKNWNAITACMNEKFPSNIKTSKQCRERWHYCLDLSINHKPWSKYEEATLIIAHMDYGNRWCDIATRFKGRHNNMIKNRFYSILRKVKNKIRINDYTSQDQLELLELYYMTSVMVNYIKHPAPPEDFKRKRGRDFMYTLVNDIAISTLENYSHNLLTYAPLEESLRDSLKRIVEAERTQGKTTSSPAWTSSYSKLPLDCQIPHLDPSITLDQILEGFCWGDKNKSIKLPEPISFDCKTTFNTNEKNQIIQELFPIKQSIISYP